MNDKWIIRLSLIILGVCAGGTVITIWEYSAEGLINCGTINSERIGTFGDFIGGFFGTLLSLVAALLVYVTYRSQARELEISRRMLSIQQFENNFFQLLSIQERIKNTTSTETRLSITWYQEFPINQSREVTGVQFFSHAAQDLVRFYQLDDTLLSPRIESRVISELAGRPAKCTTSKEEPEQRIKDVYRDFYQVYEDEIAHYMRNLYHILKYIDRLGDLVPNLEGDSLNNQKKLYSDMAQAQLSASEMIIIFYNGICFPKMKELIEKFNLLENLRPHSLADMEKHKDLYSFELKVIPF